MTLSETVKARQEDLLNQHKDLSQAYLKLSEQLDQMKQQLVILANAVSLLHSLPKDDSNSPANP